MVTVGYVLPVLQFLQNMRNGVALSRLRKSDVDIHILIYKKKMLFCAQVLLGL